jgi:hypothetical protein
MSPEGGQLLGQRRGGSKPPTAEPHWLHEGSSLDLPPALGNTHRGEDASWHLPKVEARGSRFWGSTEAQPRRPSGGDRRGGGAREVAARPHDGHAAAAVDRIRRGKLTHYPRRDSNTTAWARVQECPLRRWPDRIITGPGARARAQYCWISSNGTKRPLRRGGTQGSPSWTDMEAAGIEPASVSRTDKASTSLSHLLDLARPAGGGQPTDRASDP